MFVLKNMRKVYLSIFSMRDMKKNQCREKCKMTFNLANFLLFLFMFIFVSCSNRTDSSNVRDTISKEDELEAYVNGMKKTVEEKLPVEIDEGMTMTKISFVPGYNYFVYTIECDENIYSIEEMRRNRDAVKTFMIENGRELFTKEMIEDFKYLDIKEIQYQYKGISSGKILSIHIGISELE